MRTFLISTVIIAVILFIIGEVVRFIGDVPSSGSLVVALLLRVLYCVVCAVIIVLLAKGLFFILKGLVPVIIAVVILIAIVCVIGYFINRQQ